MTIVPQPNRELGDPVARGREVLAAALELATGAEVGTPVRVFPTHGVRAVRVPVGAGVEVELRCTCGIVACPNPGKHPVGYLVPNGHNGATTDLTAVKAWFVVPGDAVRAADWVPWNLGVATGRGIVVVDADVKQTRPDLPTGLEVLDDWETWTQGTSLPATRVVRTGSGGVHLWVRVPEGLAVKARNRVLPGVDIKGDGGYVLAAPSAHISGGRYTVTKNGVGGASEGAGEDVLGVASDALVAWLLTVKGGRYVSKKASDGVAAIPDDYNFQVIVAGSGCPAGHRDYFINDLCFRLRRASVSLDDAAAAVRREWLRMERVASDDFPWETCLYKLRRVWEEVQPEDVTDIPAWRPPGLTTPGTVGALGDVAGGAVGVGGRDDVGEGVSGPSTLELLERPSLTFALTDTGNGERFAQRMREVVRFCTGEGRWYLWDGSHWAPDELNRALLLTVEIVKDLYVEAARLPEAERPDVTNWAKQSQSLGKREAMLRAASAQPGIAIRPDDLDVDPWLLVVRNGTLDLRTGLLRESLPEDLNTRRANVDYDPDAGCPLWLKHMEFVTGGDDGLARWLRRAVGYTLTGLTDEQKLFFLWGNGANGKSTFVDVISHVLGSYATQADGGLLTASSEHPTQLAGLRGARLVVADETGQGRKLAEQRVKAITGGKTIKARYMRQDFFEFTPRFKLWITGNHKPEVAGTDHGIWRRLKLVPFTSTFTDDLRIMGYDEILLREASGILNWALAGLLDRRELGGLGEPEAVKKATGDYRAEEDVTGQWLAETCRRGAPALFTESRRLYESYRWWCMGNGHVPGSSTALGRELTALGMERDTTRVLGKTTKIWRRVELLEGVDMPAIG